MIFLVIILLFSVTKQGPNLPNRGRRNLDSPEPRGVLQPGRY